MSDSRFPLSSKKDPRRRLVEDCFRREAGSAAPIPDDSVDLIESGVLDSMAWVSFLRAVETASGVSDLGSGLNERSASLGEVLAALQNSSSDISSPDDASLIQKISSSPAKAMLTGSAAVLGSRLLPSEEVDRAFGMPVGKLRNRAGIESLAYVAESENELTLAAKARLDCSHQRNASRLPFSFGSASFSIARPRKLRRPGCRRRLPRFAQRTGGRAIADRIGTGSDRRRRHRRRSQPDTHSRPSRR